MNPATIAKEPTTFTQWPTSTVLAAAAVATGAIAIIGSPTVARTLGMIVQVCWLYIVAGTRG